MPAGRNRASRVLTNSDVPAKPPANVSYVPTGIPCASNGTNATWYPPCGRGARVHDPWNVTNAPLRYFSGNCVPRYITICIGAQCAGNATRGLSYGSGSTFLPLSPPNSGASMCAFLIGSQYENGQPKFEPSLTTCMTS